MHPIIMMENAVQVIKVSILGDAIISPLIVRFGVRVQLYNLTSTNGLAKMCKSASGGFISTDYFSKNCKRLAGIADYT